MTRPLRVDRQQYDVLRKVVLDLVNDYDIPHKRLIRFFEPRKSQGLISRVLAGREVSFPVVERLALSIQAIVKPSDRDRLQKSLGRIRRDGQ